MSTTELSCSNGGTPPCQASIKVGDMVKTTPKCARRGGLFAGRVTWMYKGSGTVEVTMPTGIVQNAFIKDLQLDCGGMCTMTDNSMADFGHNITRIETAGTVLRIVDRAGDSEISMKSLTGAIGLHHPTMILEDLTRELMTLARARAIIIDGLNASGSVKGNVFIKRGPALPDVVAMIDTYLADMAHDNTVTVTKSASVGPTTELADMSAAAHLASQPIEPLKKS